MSILNAPVDSTVFVTAPLRSKPLGTFAENFSAQRQSAKEMSGNFAERYIRDQWEPIVQEIEAVTGERLKNPGDYMFPGVFAIVTGEAARGYGRGAYEYQANEVRRYLTENSDKFPQEFIDRIAAPDLEAQWRTAAQEQALAGMNELSDLTGRSPGFLSGVARFAGGMTGGMEDPLNQAFMLIPEARIGKSFAGYVLGSAVTNAGVEAIQQPAVAEWYADLGLDYGWEEFATTIAMAAAAGAAIPTTFYVGGKAVTLTADQIKKGVDVLTAASGRKSSSQRAAEILQDVAEAHDAANPMGQTVPELAEHKGRSIEGGRAAYENRAPNLTDRPSGTVTAPADVYAFDNLDNMVFRFDPNEIKVDAETFQFKAGGDEFGVTERLRDVTQWDPVKAGQITVFEYADGNLFIADGHQRLGLAQRILSRDPSQDVRLYGYKLREVDGITPEEAMVIAALKNIAEGTGSVMDAAKIARIAPDRLSGPDFPKNSAFVRQARALAQLEKDAWGMVVNDIVPPQQAAVVGRLIPDDPDMQAAALRVLAKTEPANEFQAEAITQQVISAGMIRETQDDLFGEAFVTESLYLERAKILDRAQRQLRKDRSAFQNLINNESRLASEGNQLVTSANQRRANEDGETIARLQALANRKGPLSEALTDAARDAKDSGNYAAATERFLDAVRRSVSEGEFDSATLGNVGRDFNVEEKASAIRDFEQEQQLGIFDDPVGEGLEKTNIALEGELRTALESDQVLLADLDAAIRRGASIDELSSHPAVITAVAEMQVIPRTDLDPLYADRDAWYAQRQYIVGSRNDATAEEALASLIEGARRMGWEDEGLEFPAGAVRQERKAAIVLGPPAAGKSTIANPIARKMGAAIVDADEAKKVLPEYRRGIGANAVHEESSELSELVFQALKQNGDNIVIPKVGGKPDSIRRAIQELKSAGYEVDLVDMVVDAEEAMRRMFARFVATGRLINPDFVRAIGNGPAKTYDTLRSEGVADGYARIDNGGAKDAAKPVIEDTRNILDGVELRLQRRGGEGVSDSAAGASTEASRANLADDGIEELAVPQISENMLDAEFPVAERINPDTGEIEAYGVTARELLDEIDSDNAMIERLNRCPI